MRTIAFLLVVTTCGSCMKMRETVQRMVMVRTTGSDLQPAATGYLYKKESDGPASVTHMGESEVMEHLKKFYEQPEAFAAPIPLAAGPFYAKEDDESKVGSESKETHVIPVVEKSEEEDNQEDGIADEDYGKIFDNYAKHYENHKNDFDEYLKGLGVYHEHGGGKEHDSNEHYAKGDKGHQGFKTIHHYGKGDAGDYNKKNYESYSVSSGGDHKKDYDNADAYRKHYGQGHGYKEGDHGYKQAHSKGEETGGFHKVYDKDEEKKDHDFYDGNKHEGSFHKYGDGHEYHGSGVGGHKQGGSGESGHHESGFGKDGHHEKGSGETEGAGHSAKQGGESSYGKHSDFGSKGGHQDGNSFGFKVQH